MPIITAFEIIDHGCDGESYFPSCGVAFTKWQEVYTGMGESAFDAIKDALDLLDTDPAEYTWNHEVQADLEKEVAALPKTEIVRDADTSDEWHHYVSIRIKFIT